MIKAIRNVYGHPVSGKVWYDLACSFLIGELGFTRSYVDRCLFTLARIVNVARIVVFVLLYVDDLAVAGHEKLRNAVA